MSSHEKMRVAYDRAQVETPREALEALKAGNARFVAGSMRKRDLAAQVAETAPGQHPFAAVLGCIDSRVPPEMVFDQGIGDLFSARVAGNFVNDDILGSLEFATAVAGAKLIVVLGHTACGAVKGAADGVQLGHLTGVVGQLRPAVEAVESRYGERSSANAAFVDEAARLNVLQTRQAMLDRSEVINGRVEEGSLDVVGAMYAVATGHVEFLT